MNNQLYLQGTPAVGAGHYYTCRIPSKAMLDNYMAANKLHAVTNRLQEPTASYNKVVSMQSQVEKAIAVFLSLRMVMAADATKLIEGEVLLHNRSSPSTSKEKEISTEINRRIEAELAMTLLDAYSCLATAVFLLRTVPGQVVALCLALLATWQLGQLESRESKFFETWTASSPLRGHSLRKFDALQSAEGFDCSICQGDIGEEEWIYPIPCQHQFHR